MYSMRLIGNGLNAINLYHLKRVQSERSIELCNINTR